MMNCLMRSVLLSLFATLVFSFLANLALKRVLYIILAAIAGDGNQSIPQWPWLE